MTVCTKKDLCDKKMKKLKLDEVGISRISKKEESLLKLNQAKKNG